MDGPRKWDHVLLLPAPVRFHGVRGLDARNSRLLLRAVAAPSLNIAPRTPPIRGQPGGKNRGTQKPPAGPGTDAALAPAQEARRRGRGGPSKQTEIKKCRHVVREKRGSKRLGSSLALLRGKPGGDCRTRTGSEHRTKLLKLFDDCSTPPPAWLSSVRYPTDIQVSPVVANSHQPVGRGMLDALGLPAATSLSVS